MTKIEFSRLKSLVYPTELVIAASCQAFAENSERYVKPSDVISCERAGERLGVTEYKMNDNQSQCFVNAERVRFLLENQSQINEDFKPQAQAIIKHFRSKNVISILAGKIITDFDMSINSIVTKETVTGLLAYNGTVAFLPQAYANDQARSSIENRIRDARGGYLGKPGQKIDSVKVEILRCIWSSNWNTHYVTAITDSDQVIFFSFSEKLAQGSQVTLKGRIKDHMENSQTRMNFVRVLN
jgi:hypothetical protein